MTESKLLDDPQKEGLRLRKKKFNKNTEIKSITVLGVGSLGGFFADSISKFDGLEELILVDYDKVEDKNISNSIYLPKHIGMFKVDALEDFISSDKIKITKLYCKYIEGDVEIPKCDLVVDCRDFVYNRMGGIDIRLYITGRYLIVDCNRIASYGTNYEGKYRESLTKIDIGMAGIMAAKLISDRTFIELINNKAVFKYDIDSQRFQSRKTIKRLKYSDVLCDIDQYERGNKITDLIYNYSEIITRNKTERLFVHVNDLEEPLIKKTIPKKSLKNYDDVAKILTSIINFDLSYQFYTIDIATVDLQTYIILLPETGGA